MARLDSAYEEAADIHRHTGYIIVASIILASAIVIIGARMLLWPSLPLLVEGAARSAVVPIHFSSLVK